MNVCIYVVDIIAIVGFMLFVYCIIFLMFMLELATEALFFATIINYAIKHPSIFYTKKIWKSKENNRTEQKY